MVAFFGEVASFIMAIALAAGEGLSDEVGVGEALVTGAGASWVNSTFTVGAEKVKLFADRYSHPPVSFETVVATSFVPSEEITEIDAFMGALENLYRHLATSDLITKL
jgi:hypothetical protein